MQLHRVSRVASVKCDDSTTSFFFFLFFLLSSRHALFIPIVVEEIGRLSFEIRVTARIRREILV